MTPGTQSQDTSSYKTTGWHVEFESRVAHTAAELSVCSADAAHAEKPAVVKKVAATMTVGKLKAMTHRLFKAKGGPRKLSLTYQSAEEQSAGNPGVELTEWDSDLQYYSVTNGGRVTARSG